MIVTTDANKAVQAYSGNNTNQPSYLITPQIVTPAGDKALSFTATAAEPYTSSGTIQIGVASKFSLIVATCALAVIAVSIKVPKSSLNFIMLLLFRIILQK